MGGSEAPRVAMSPKQAAYFEGLARAARAALDVAKAARRRGLDPSLDVEIPLAEDLAARVEEQVQIRGIAARIRELSKEQPSRELVSLLCAKEVAAGRFQQWPSSAMALDKAVRAGLSILTEGILVAPLEGIAKVQLGQNQDGSTYVDLYFAGPIRAAGGTAQAMSVLIADVVRRELGIGRFVATQAEIERYKEEVPAYKRAQHLQYAPSGDEVEHIIRHCPVCINGEGTEQEEVTGHRNLPRVETNQLRGGAVLVLAEGLTQKAPKIMKIVDKLKVPDWDFLNAFVKKGPTSDPKPGDDVGEIEASDKFIKELIGGRPVLAHPSRVGGFRLRYGRSRTAGLASTSISPIAMHVLDDFLAVGTQMKIERPGKGTIATPASSLEGPMLLLRNGDLVQPASIEAFRALGSPVVSIVDLGEILIPFGEFSENNAILPDASFTYEWWREELKAVAPEAEALAHPRFAEAMEVSRRHGIPLHPDHNLFWHDLDWESYRRLCRGLLAGRVVDGVLEVPKDPRTKQALIALGALHRESDDAYLIADRGEALLAGCGIRIDAGRLAPALDLDAHLAAPPSGRFPIVQAAARATGVPIKARAPTRIGARMGRPEKADKRVMDPPVHVLFPVGHEGGSQRNVEDAASHGKITVKVGIRRCKECGREAYLARCSCGARTEPTGAPAQERELPVRDEFRRALDRLKAKTPKKLKGVQGLVSQAKLPEPLEKGILRANHDLWVFKDGTVRFDATDAPLTHFTPQEIGTSITKLRELGYETDAHGAHLERPDQVVELRVQDVVLPLSGGEYFVHASQFVDELLERFYGLPAFYGVKEPRDLVGHLVAGLAPHTSGAVLGRIIGFTKASVGYAHPFYHAAKRRNCVAGETELFVYNSPTPVRTSFEALWDRAAGATRVVDRFGTEARTVHGLRAQSIDPKTGKAELREITHVYRMPAPKYLLEITTATGRRLRCTADHPLVLASKDGLLRRPAVQSARAPAAVALRVPHEPVEAAPLDLVQLFLKHRRPWMVIRKVRGWVRGYIGANGGFNAAARSVGLTPKQLDNFRRRDSFPARVIHEMRSLAPAGLDALPPDAEVGAVRDDVNLPRFVPFTPEFLRFCGYYLAEGHSRMRAGSLFQVSIAATESEIREDVQACAAKAFGLSPYKTQVALTFSSRALHFLIADHLALGRNAHEKRIPPVLAALPDALTAHLLRAYLAGDGHVSKRAALVSCTSVSRGLLVDIGHQMTRRGIRFRLKTTTRPAGGAVKAFLIRKGRPLRDFTIHKLEVGSGDALRVIDEIGVALSRKQMASNAWRSSLGKSRIRSSIGDIIQDTILNIEKSDVNTEYVYDIEVNESHIFATAEYIYNENCDGDEDAFMLLLDAFLNFSRSFIPDRRGGLMDLPLVLATRIDPSEIDKEAHNVDVGWSYPLEFYRATEQHRPAKDVAAKMQLVGQRLGTPGQFEGFGYTVESRSIHEGPAESAYKTLGTMPEKMAAQLSLADRLRGVDAADVATRVISHHLLPDLIGNLKAFAKQSVRCTKCNTKYRRIPVGGKCTRVLQNGRDMCENPLSLTVHQASVRKYLDICLELCKRYEIPAYTRQHIELVQRFIDDTFRVRDVKLTAFG